MPLSRLQSEILRLIGAGRNPDSYVAGATVLNRTGPRTSHDIDIFHDREEVVAEAAAADAAVLATHGFDVSWLRREPGIHAAVVTRDGESTRLEWVRDTDFRFFPTMEDRTFGRRLHLADIATNKALAAAGRCEPRDVLDLLFIHEHRTPLGAVVWAAVAKDAGYSPESLIAEIRRNARYRADDFADLAVGEPIDAGDVLRRFRRALDEAADFVAHMPTEKAGLLFIKDGAIVQPDPGRLGDYVEHAGTRRGHWPSSAEIGSAMLEHEGKPE